MLESERIRDRNLKSFLFFMIGFKQISDKELTKLLKLYNQSNYEKSKLTKDDLLIGVSR